MSESFQKTIGKISLHVNLGQGRDYGYGAKISYTQNDGTDVRLEVSFDQLLDIKHLIERAEVAQTERDRWWRENQGEATRQMLWREIKQALDRSGLNPLAQDPA